MGLQEYTQKCVKKLAMNRMETDIGDRYWREKGTEREVEYVTISVVLRVWNTLKADRKSVCLNCWLVWRSDTEVGRHFM